MEWPNLSVEVRVLKKAIDEQFGVDLLDLSEVVHDSTREIVGCFAIHCKELMPLFRSGVMMMMVDDLAVVSRVFLRMVRLVATLFAPLLLHIPFQYTIYNI